MLATITISLIAILFAWLARFQKSKYGGLEVAFVLLTVFMSVRYNFGNDYSAYLNSFLEIGRYTSFDFISSRTEIGWSFLNLLFQPIGFFGMIIILTVFEYTVIYRLIKKHVPKDWYWLSVFIFAFSTSYMLIFGSMMRQFLATCIFIIAIEFSLKKRWIISILLVLFASLFHTSVLIFLPFCFVGYLDLSLTNKKALIWFGVYFFLYFIGVNIFSNIFFKFIELEQFERYQYYLADEEMVSGRGLGVAFNMIIYATLLLHQRFQSRDMKIIFILFYFSLFFNMFIDLAPLVSRLGVYLSVFSIVCYPMMFKAIKNDLYKSFLLIGYILFTVLLFTLFFKPGGTWYDSFYTYQTIFSVTSWM